MTLALGHLGGHFGFGLEGAWGTADTITQKLKLRTGGDGVVKTVYEILSEEILNYYRDDSESVAGNISVGGPLTFAMQYEGYELLLKHLLGAVSSSQPDVTNDANTWLNTYTMLAALPEGLTFEIDIDTHEKVVEGGMIARAEFSCDVNGLLICTINIIGEDMNLTTSPTGALSFPTAAYIDYADKPTSTTVVQYNNTDIEVANLRWYFDNSLDADRRFIGTNLISRPTRMGKVDCGGSFQIEFDATTEYDDFVAHTKRALEIEFMGAVIDANFNYNIKFLFDAIRLRSHPVSVDDEGRITVDVEFKAYAEDGTNLEMEVTAYSTVDASSL